MERYIRTNDDGMKVLDYDLLDIAARVGFLEYVQRMADDIQLDLDDPDFSNAEKNEALNSAANQAVDGLWLDDSDIEEGTREMIIERITSSLAGRYGVNL